MTIAQTDSTAGGVRPSRYDSVSMTLHWLIALVVILNIALGLYMGDLPRTDPMKFTIMQLHFSFGLTVLILSVLRVVWRLMHKVPGLPAGMSAPERWAAKGMHFAFYVLILALPLSGWAILSASPRGPAIPYFGMFHWPAIWFLSDLDIASKKAIVHTIGDTHEFLAWTMIVLVPIHVLAALFHQHVRKDGALARMLPWGK
jgi:cytochrome b561